MLRRELAVALGARITWFGAAASAFIMGHGYVLAVDLYSAGSRHVGANRLLAAEFDPLLGVVRPLLGGLYVTVAILGALAAARVTAVEKERETFFPVLLQTGAPLRWLLCKFTAACVACGLQGVSVFLLLASWLWVGGHLHAAEVGVALLGHALFVILTAALGTAAAVWSASLAQAAVVTMAVVMAGWALEAAQGYSTLAWVGELGGLSVGAVLASFEKGTLVLGHLAWLLGLTTAALAVAFLGTRWDWRYPKIAALGLGVLAVMGALHVSGWATGFDLTQDSRASLPPAAVTALQALPAPPRLEVYLTQEDSRRQQLESDVLAKLRLARPDLVVDMPLDRAVEAPRDDAEEVYGRILVHGPRTTLETRSAGRQELTVLILEAQGMGPPDWAQRAYSGYPCVVEGYARTALHAWAYLLVPGLFLLAGLYVSRPLRRVP